MKGFKKAFTIVELVIVIAVIAILAAVLIPTFSNIIRKANISNDTQLVRNLNTALVVDRAVNGEHKTMQSALDAAFDAGYDLAKINARANQNEILWDSKNDVFCYYNDDTKEIEYIPEFPGHDPVGQNEQYLFWKIYSATPEAQKYSIYWNSNSNFTPSLKVGFDAGKSTGVTSLNYVGSGSAQDVVIRTNGGTLTVNAPADTVRHYGEADSVNIVAVASASYHENGTVKFVEISKGRMALETGAEVNHIHINAKVVNDVKQDVFDNIIIAKANDVAMPEFSRDDVEIATAGTLVVALQTGTEEITESTELDYVWLTKQGVYEQITVSENNTSAGTTWVNTSNKPAETKTAAQQIANNIGTTATVGETTYDVAVDETTRDIVLKETGTDTVAYTVTVEEGKTVVTTTGENPTTVEVEVVEAQPDKEDIQIGATLFAGGSGTKNDPYLIANGNQWVEMCTYYKTQYEGYYGVWKSGGLYVKLIDNIDLSDVELYQTYFIEGLYLDGNGKTVSNSHFVDIFGEYELTWNSTNVIKDLTLDNCNSRCSLFGYGLADGASVSFINVDIKNSISNSGSYLFYSNKGELSFKDCDVTNTTITGGTNMSIGGFCGQWHTSNIRIEDCSFHGQIIAIANIASGFVTAHAGAQPTIINSTIKEGTVIKNVGGGNVYGFSNGLSGQSTGNVFNGTAYTKTAATQAIDVDASQWVKLDLPSASDFTFENGTITYTGASAYTKAVVTQTVEVDKWEESETKWYSSYSWQVVSNITEQSIYSGKSWTVPVVSHIYNVVGNESELSKGFLTTSNRDYMTQENVVREDSFYLKDGTSYLEAKTYENGNYFMLTGTHGDTAPANIQVRLTVTLYDGTLAAGTVVFTYNIPVNN